MAADKHLGIYLNDHLAGAVAGVELAKRAARNNEGTEFGEFLQRLVDEVKEDRSTLEELMSALDIPKNRAKDVGAWLVEKAGRLKLNGQLTGYSDLSRVLELEGLSLGVEGKLSMWRSLLLVKDKYPPIAVLDLDSLIERAVDQRRGLEEFRQKAVTTAF